MDNAKKLRIYQAQTKNVQELNTARKQLTRTINDHLIRNQNPAMHPSVEAHTKALALLFSAWSEALFSKIIHTPHAFDENELNAIKKAANRTLENGWKKCLEISLNRVAQTSNSSVDVNLIRQKIDKIVQDYVVTPRAIRNKIAHGQWAVALNSEQTDINPKMVQYIQSLDVVKIDNWFDVFSDLAEIIETLVESPNKAFARDYATMALELDNKLQQRQSWSLSTKITNLKQKAARRATKTLPSTNTDL